MKNENIEGIGSVHGGEYDTIQVDGIGKLKGNAAVRNINVDGMFKSKGNIKADTMSIDGIARIFRDIKVKNINVNGVLKLRRAKLSADKISCDGIIFCNKEVNADDIYIHGACSIYKIYGDKIKLINNTHSWDNSKIPIKIMFLLNLYMGRKASLTHSLVDILECTDLEASGLKSKIIRANNVNIVH
jgi:cytoskeletal protein CcmA (bactofilin family)